MKQPPVDVPFVDVEKRVDAARRYGSIRSSFFERSIDLHAADCERVASAASNLKMMKYSDVVVQDRDSNRYALLYFIGPPEGFPLKIGITHNAFGRLSELQTGNWQQLGIHGMLYSESVGEIERRVHRIARSADIQERGEWIWATLPTAVDIVLQATRELGAKLLTPAMVIYNQGMAMKARDQAIAKAEYERNRGLTSLAENGLTL